MRLTEVSDKIKALGKNTPELKKDVFIALLIILVAIGAYILGRISTLDTERRGELRIIASENLGSAERPSDNPETGNTPPVHTTSALGEYVASRTGTTYYLPWCGGVKRIREENKVWFKTKEEAELKGYRPAANCKGI